jgi:hypothetical protein
MAVAAACGGGGGGEEGGGMHGEKPGVWVEEAKGRLIPAR